MSKVIGSNSGTRACVKPLIHLRTLRLNNEDFEFSQMWLPGSSAWKYFRDIARNSHVPNGGIYHQSITVI